MTLKKFEPENELEQAILQAKNGAVSVKDMMQIFFRSHVYIVGLDENSTFDEAVVHEDWQNFFPLRFDVGGQPMAAVFSSLAKARSYNHKSAHILKMLGRDQIARLPPENGIVLNAGYDAQIKIAPSGIDEMKMYLKGEQEEKNGLADFRPENDLEDVILAAKRGDISPEDVFERLINSDIFISSRSDLKTDWAGFDPLLVTYEGESYIAIFSSLDRPDPQRHFAKHILPTRGSDFIKRMAPQYGLVMNPGYFAYFLVPPSRLAEYRKKSAKQ